MEDYTQCLAKNKQKIMLDSEKLTRQRTTLQHTDWLNRNARSGESKCGQRRSTSRRLSTPSLTILFGRHSKSCNVDHEFVSLLRKIYRDQKASVQTDEESEIYYEFKKATEKVGLKMHPDKTKILSNQSTMNFEHKKMFLSR